MSQTWNAADYAANARFVSDLGQPVLDQPGGRGLWLANQLCDLVQVRTFELGNVVRIHMAR